MISYIKFMIMLGLFVLLIGGCVQKEDLSVASPNGKVSVLFELLEGVSHYSVVYNGVGIIEPSALGFRSHWQ